MSTSFKQSALTIAVLFTIPALSHAAEEFVITEGTQYETNKYAGIYQPTEDFNSDVVVTTGTLPEGHTRIFGMQLDNHEITFHGSVSVDANATTPGAMAYGIRVDKAANVTIMGDTTIHASTQDAALDSQGNAVGILANGYGQIDLSSGHTNVTLEVGKSRAYGFQLLDGGSVTIGATDLLINVHDKKEDSVVLTKWVEGIHAAGANFIAKDSVNITINGIDKDGQLVDLEDRIIRGINLEGSAYNTYAQFDKDVTVAINANVDDIYGVYVSGDTQSTSELHAGVHVSGNLNVNIQGEVGNAAVGLYAQGESGMSANKANIRIQSTGVDGSVYGIYAVANPQFYPGPGDVTVENGVTIDVSAIGEAYGIISKGDFENRSSDVSIGGSSQIHVISECEAIGIIVDENAKASLSNVQATIESHGDSMEAVGVMVNGSSLELQGTNSISSEGGTAIGFQLTDAKVNLVGSTQVKADQALTGDKDSVVNVTKGSGSTGELILIGNVNNQGSINLTDSTLSVKETTEKTNLGTINTIGVVGSTISLSAGDYLIDSLNGETKSLVLTDLVNTKGVQITQKSGDLRMVADGNSNDQYANAQMAASAISSTVTIEQDEEGSINSVEIQAGAVNDALSATLNQDGTLSDVRITKNETLDALGSVTALSALSLRHEMNSLSKRMGELRDAPDGVGLWARAYGSEMEYGSQNVTAKSNSIQIGGDQSIGDWKVGLAFTYTDGEASYDHGSADNKGYGLALYGTWFVPCGAYLDLMAKYNRLENDFALNGMNGDYDSNAYAVSVETGYRFEFLQGGLYVEPQIGVNYGHVQGEQFKTSNGVSIDQGDYDSLIGRIGVRTGFKFPNNKGTIYARASGVYDFDGDMSAKAIKGAARNTIEEDLGGAWIEMGVGANFNWTDNTYTYIDFERTNGGEVKENYRWNIGVRHTF